MQYQILIGTITSFVLLFLSLLHVFWALGGRLGYLAVIPETGNKPAFTPGPGITWVVAIVLFGFGAVAFWSTGILYPPNRISSWFCYGLAFLFLGRAIGDFRLVGFFKKVKSTRFAKHDYLLYSPLCLLLSLAYLYLGFGNS